MRPTILALLLLACAASGQWLENVVRMPDSLAGVCEPSVLAYAAGANKVYVGGVGDGLSVLDATTHRKIGRVPYGIGILSMCYDPAGNRLYYGDSVANNVTVIDCATDSLVAQVALPGPPDALCFNGTSNKLYCASARSSGDALLAIIDATADSIVGLLNRADDGPPASVCHNRRDNKIYWSHFLGLTILDGASDTILAEFSTADTHGYALCYDEAGDKVYASFSTSGTVLAIDGVTNQIIKRIRIGNAPGPVCLDRVTHQAYVACLGGGIAAIDCARDSVVAVIGASRPSVLCDIPTEGKLYWGQAAGDTVGVVDCRTNSTVARLPTPRVAAMAFDSVANAVYCADKDDHTLTVIDGATNGISGLIPVGADLGALCVNTVNGKAYCAVYDSAGRTRVAVIDCATGVHIRDIVTPAPNQSLHYDPVHNKLYCVNRGDPISNLVVVDADVDTVLRILPIPGVLTGMAFNARTNRAYATLWNSGIAVIDAVRDTLLGVLQAGVRYAAVSYNPASNTFCASGYWNYRVDVFDGANDSLIAAVGWELEAPAVCCNPLSDKFYVAYQGPTYPHPDEGAVLVVNGSTGAVITRINSGAWGLVELDYNYLGNTVCGVQESGSPVIDGERDYIVDRIANPSPWSWQAMAFNGADNRLYFASGDRVWVFDGVTYDTVKTVLVPPGAYAIAVCPSPNRVLATCVTSSSIAMLGTSSSSAPDVGIRAITRPVGAMDSGSSVAPQAFLINHGPQRESVRVVFSIRRLADGSPHYPAVHTPGLASDCRAEVLPVSVCRPDSAYEETTFVLPEPFGWAVAEFPTWPNVQPGLYEMIAQSYVSGDANPLNDTLRDTVRVRAWHDAGVTAILAPSATIESGAVVVPRAVVKCDSRVPEVFDVRFSIGTVYDDVRTVTLAPLSVDTVDFAAWNADSVGIFQARCSSMLASDSLRGNDRRAVNFRVLPVGAVAGESALPEHDFLGRSAPTHFRGSVFINYGLANGSSVSLSVLAADGSVVREVVADMRAPGRYRAVWDGRNERGRSVPAGVYYWRLVTRSARAVVKVVKLD